MRLDTKTTSNLALPDGKTEQIFWDSELRGFGLRLRRRGDRLHRSWIAQYRVNGRTRRPKLGSAETLLAHEARAAARKVLAGAALGGDPQQEKQTRRRAATRVFSAVVGSYLEARRTELRANSFRSVKRYLTGPYFKPLHVIGVSEITHADVAACIRTIEQTRSAITAGCARRALSTLFAWAIAEGLMGPRPINPVVGTRQPAGSVPRDRVLTNAELVAIWNATASDAYYSKIVRLLMLLASRPAEIGGMRWAELNLDTGTWSLPKQRSKNHRAHEIVLSKPALAIIRSVEQQPGRDCLFGAHVGFKQWWTAKLMLDRQLGDQVKPWRLHDVRRSVATGMADIGIMPHVIEQVLNHQSGHRAGVAGIYNRARYDREVTAALVRWSEHLLALVEGRASNIVALTA
jgi:integrase